MTPRMECRVRIVVLLATVAVLVTLTAASPVAPASHIIKSPKGRLLEKRGAVSKVGKIPLIDTEPSKQDNFVVPDTKERVEQQESKSNLAQIQKSPNSQKGLLQPKAPQIRDSRHRKRSARSPSKKLPLPPNRPKRSLEYVADGLVPVVEYPDDPRAADDYFYADEPTDDYEYVAEPLTEQELENLALVAAELQQLNDGSDPRPYGSDPRPYGEEVDDDQDQVMDAPEAPEGEDSYFERGRRAGRLLPSLSYGSIYQSHYPKYRYGMFGKRGEPDYDAQEEFYRSPVVVPVVVEDDDDFDYDNTLDPALAERIRYLAEQL